MSRQFRAFLPGQASRLSGSKRDACPTFGKCCAAVVACSILTAGCGDSRLVPVSGKVTLDGKPTADVLVHFQPSSKNARDAEFSPGSHGVTDAKGRYALETSDDSGAIVGEHVVTLVYQDPKTVGEDPYDESGREKPRQFKLPPKARNSSLKTTVPEGGTSEADFAFESR